VNQYLVYERRGLDYISPRKVSDLFSAETADRVFRLGEPQGLAEVNGMLVPGAPVTDVGKRQTFWLEYHLGITNASNSKSDGNGSKGVYGRYVMRWYNQSLGGFAFYASDIADDAMRAEGAAAGVLSGRGTNSTVRAGPDATLSLAPLGFPVSLENEVLYNREGDPTGFGKEFVWWGGFHQLNWFISKRAVTYARYDWIKGDRYDDTTAGGITKADPREWDVIAGLQFLVLENFKLIGEYRHHEFRDCARPPPASWPPRMRVKRCTRSRARPAITRSRIRTTPCTSRGRNGRTRSSAWRAWAPRCRAGRSSRRCWTTSSARTAPMVARLPKRSSRRRRWCDSPELHSNAGRRAGAPHPTGRALPASAPAHAHHRSV